MLSINSFKFAAISLLPACLSLTAIGSANANQRVGDIVNGGGAQIVLSCFYNNQSRVATVSWRLIPRPDRPPEATVFLVRVLRVGESRKLSTRLPSGSHPFRVVKKPSFASIEGQAIGTITIGRQSFLYTYAIDRPFGVDCSVP